MIKNFPSKRGTLTGEILYSFIVDWDTGETIPVYLFVGTLSFSMYGIPMHFYLQCIFLSGNMLFFH